MLFTKGLTSRKIEHRPSRHEKSLARVVCNRNIIEQSKLLALDRAKLAAARFYVIVSGVAQRSKALGGVDRGQVVHSPFPASCGRKNALCSSPPMPLSRRAAICINARVLSASPALTPLSSLARTVAMWPRVNT